MTDKDNNLKTDLPAGNKAMSAENFYENKPKDDGWGPTESKRTEREKSQDSASRPSKRHELPKPKKWAPFERPRATTGNIHQSNLPGKSLASSARKNEVENEEEKEFNDFLRGNQDGFF